MRHVVLKNGPRYRCEMFFNITDLPSEKGRKIYIIAMALKKDTHPSQCPSHLRREEKKTDGEISLEMEKFFGFRPFGQEW